MSILSTITRAADALRARRRLSRTERMIGALPPELRKDIGWPDAWTRQGPGHAGTPDARCR